MTYGVGRALKCSYIYTSYCTDDRFIPTLVLMRAPDTVRGGDDNDDGDNDEDNDDDNDDDDDDDNDDDDDDDDGVSHRYDG